MKKVKGYCTQCLNWRAFQLQDVYTDIQRVFVMGRLAPVATIGGIKHCIGTCSRGHYGPFSIWEPLRAPRYAREVKPYRFTGRGYVSLTAYLFWRTSFKRPRQEEHYKRGHECSFACPEYAEEWDVERWGLN